MPYSGLRGLRSSVRSIASLFSLLLVLLALTNLSTGNQLFAAGGGGGAAGGSTPPPPPTTEKGKALEKAKKAAKEKCEKDCTPKKKAATATPTPAGGGEPPPSGGGGTSGGGTSGGGTSGGGTAGGGTASTPSAEEVKKKCIKDCCTKAFKKLVETNSKWKFGPLDDKHPDYDQIMEDILDSLIDSLNTDPGMADLNITYSIKNVKHLENGVSVSGWTQQTTQGGNEYTTTYYNPNSTTIGQLRGYEFAKQTRGYAQPADESNQFQHNLFITLTVAHELAHVKLLALANTDPAKVLSWMTIWGNAQATPATLPDQRYLDPLNGNFDLAFTHDMYWGFAVARSYYKTGLTFINPEVWNFVSTL